MQHAKLNHAVVCVTITLSLVTTTIHAQDKSVAPGINKPFLKPDVTEFQGKFEKDGREPYDHRDKIVEICKLREGMVVADVGAGTGLFTRLFSPRVGEQGRVFAIDIAPDFLTHIAQTARKENLKNIETVLCKPDSVELPHATVDLVFICDTYHHFEFPQKTMLSIHKALKPNGRVVLIDFNRIPGKSTEWVMNHVRAGQEVFEKEITECGFKRVEQVENLLKENYLLIFEKQGELKP